MLWPTKHPSLNTHVAKVPERQKDKQGDGQTEILNEGRSKFNSFSKWAVYAICDANTIFFQTPQALFIVITYRALILTLLTFDLASTSSEAAEIVQ